MASNADRKMLLVAFLQASNCSNYRLVASSGHSPRFPGPGVLPGHRGHIGAWQIPLGVHRRSPSHARPFR